VVREERERKGSTIIDSAARIEQDHLAHLRVRKDVDKAHGRIRKHKRFDYILS
jgi:hypothetical protein